MYHKVTVEMPALRFGTSLERNAPESLTQALSNFVHCHISRHLHDETPIRVIRAKTDYPVYTVHH